MCFTVDLSSCLGSLVRWGCKLRSVIGVTGWAPCLGEASSGWSCRVGSPAGLYYRLGFKAAQSYYSDSLVMWGQWLCSAVARAAGLASCSGRLSGVLPGCQTSMAIFSDGAGLEALLSIKKDYEFAQ